MTTDADALFARWHALDARIQTWWAGDVRTAQEDDIRADDRVIVHGIPQPLSPEEAALLGGGEAHTLLFLPHPYVTAGGSEGAFAEQYAWDTYFINLGLLAHGEAAQVRRHHLNQLFLIARYGFVLTANRTYYRTRSQTPLLAEGLRRYHEQHPDGALLMQAYPLLVAEYEGYWTAPHHQTPTGLATNRDIGTGHLRPALAAEAEVTDFTAAFDGDVRQCNPVMTNAALVRYARNLAWMAGTLGWPDEAARWDAEAGARAERMRSLLWDEAAGFFFEYHYERGVRLPYYTLGAYFALWAGVPTPAQAARMVEALALFEQPHGLAFTPEPYPSPHPEFTTLQWNYPSAWPPFQLIVMEGLSRYGYHEAAGRLARRFLTTMLDQYDRTGKLWEKYNAVAGGLAGLPEERYAAPPFHGWSAALVAVLGRRLFAAATA